MSPFRARSGTRGGGRAALGFLTVLGPAAPPSPSAVRWFPAVGALVGAVVGGAWWAAGQVLPPATAAVVALAVDLALTGLLHVDGLLDSADGLLPHLDRERRLAVMAEPTVGAFAVGVGGAVLLARWAGLASVEPAPVLVVAAWTASRALAAIALTRLPSARPSGLTRSFRGAASAIPAVGAGAAATALAGWWHLPTGPVALALGIGAASAVLLLGLRRLGGVTGDVLGAAIVVCETVVLVGASAA